MFFPHIIAEDLKSLKGISLGGKYEVFRDTKGGIDWLADMHLNLYVTSLFWWDADQLREICSRRTVSKWKGDVLSNIPGSVQLTADILGDWREEIVTYSNGELRIYSTVIPAADRRVCLLQDPLYRNDVTHRSMGYTHYPMTSYYLGK